MPISLLGDALLAAARMLSQADPRFYHRVTRITPNGHTDHCPDSVLLADVVRTGTERFLTTDGEAASIHQVAEKLPT